MPWKTLIFLLAGGVARAAPLAEEIAFYEKLVEDGNWNERVYAVNQLGRKGRHGQKGVEAATRDPDWQVRLNAVHWLGRLEGAAPASFEAIARSEACPWVRLAALHWLGRTGGESPLESATRVQEDAGACRTWSWPAKEGRGRKTEQHSRTLARTLVDDAGCQYVQFQKKRGGVCPRGAILRGIGMAPYKTKLGLGRAQNSGVALCCPGDPARGPLASATGRPAQVECRLVPEECPKGWTLLEPARARPWENRDYKYRRTHSHRLGDLNWVPCCRPHRLENEGEGGAPAAEEIIAAPPPAAVPGRNYLAEEEEFRRREERARERDEADEDEDEPPEFDERSIARALLGRRAVEAPAFAPRVSDGIERVPNTERVLEIDALIDAIEEELAGVEPIAPRGEPAVDAQAKRLDARREEAPSSRIARADRNLGEAEDRLGGPLGPGPRRARAVEGRPAIEEDHGRPEPEHDALPVLLKRLRSRDWRTRARAAEALGALGAKGKPAIAPLRGALRDRSPGVRANAAIALGNLTRGGDEAVDGLKRLLDDKHPDVRYSAAQALGRIGTPAASRAFHKSMRSGMRIFLGSKGEF